MTDKYYTPTIDEFYVGFECEIESSWGIQKGTYPSILNADTLMGFEVGQLGEHKTLLRNVSNIKVKYLDKEDIESFGFIHLPKKSLTNLTERFEMDYIGRIHPDQGYYYNKLFIKYHPDLKQLVVTAGTDGTIKENGDDNEKFFEGVIKNKSELSKLLKQLNINNE